MLSLPRPQEAGVSCDLCGQHDFRLLHAWDPGDPWNPATIPIAVWECQSCTLIMLHPVPRADQLPDAGDWWSSGRTRFRRRRWLKSRWEKLRFRLFGHPQWRMIQATRRLADGGELLDVGCGFGGLMEHAAKHFRCVGLEPSPVAADKVRQRGFDVIQDTFEAARIEPASFDVVTMDSVIEHVASPVDVLRKVNFALKPGGVVVLKTPKFGGPAYLRHREHWNGFRHGYHTFLFTASTLGLCLQAAGFEVARRPKRDRPLDDILMLWGIKVREMAHALPKAA